MKIFVDIQNMERQNWLSKTNEYNKFDGNGDNIPPTISWEDSPQNTKSFAITLYDVNAPTGSGFWHWILLNIPSEVNSIDFNNYVKYQNIRNDFGDADYSGACPPLGDKEHEYVFTVHALDTEVIDANGDMTNAIVRFLINHHTLDKASISTFYKR